MEEILIFLYPLDSKRGQYRSAIALLHSRRGVDFCSVLNLAATLGNEHTCSRCFPFLTHPLTRICDR